MSVSKVERNYINAIHLPVSLSLSLSPFMKRGPAGCFLEEEGVARHVRPQRLDDRKLQRHKAAHAIPGPHGDPPQSSESPFPSSNRKPSPAVSLETTLPSEPLISQVPLRVTQHHLPQTSRLSKTEHIFSHQLNTPLGLEQPFSTQVCMLYSLGYI